MKFNYRKIASLIASAVMVSSTVGFAAAATYPAPFVESGSPDGAVVFGTNAAPTDMAAAIELQGLLNEKVTAKSGDSSSSTVTGESIDLETSSQRLYMGSNLNTARTILTKSELPTVLPDGTATDLTGTTYDYTQQITLGDSLISFGKSGESIDPIAMVAIGTSAGDPLYNYTITLQKAMNVSDATNIVGYATLSMQGVDYVVGANSDYNTLYLYGAGTAVSVDEGETATVTVDGTEHEITLLGTSSTTSATIIVDGSQRTVTRGNSYKFAGDFEVYVKEVFHATKTGTLSNVDLLLGANTLLIENGNTVVKGADNTPISKTKGYITGTINANTITAITISQAAQKSKGDYLAAGDTYKDRVFGGIEFAFAGTDPALNSEDREMIEANTDNSVSATISFNSRLGGETGAFTYAKDSDGVSDSSLATINLVNDENKTIHVVEAENAFTDDVVIVNAGDNGRMLVVGDIPDSSSTATLRLSDAIDDSQYWDISVGVSNQSTINIDGHTYYVMTTGADAGTMNITWGAGASYGKAGTQTTIYPRIRLASGAWLSFLKQLTVTNSTTYIMPGVDLVTTYETGQTIGPLGLGVGTGESLVVGNINYTLTTLDVDNLTATIDSVYLGTTQVIFNTSMGPAVLISEEDTLADSDGHAIAIPLTSEGTTTKMPAVGSPVMSDGTTISNTLDSDNSITQAVDTYGTLIQRDTDDNNVITLYYPDDQMTAQVLVTEVGAVVTPGGTGDGEQIKAVYDNEISTVKDMNLIVVGGSCVNTVAALIVGGSEEVPICGAAFTEKTGVGAGQYLIKTVASPYNADKIAMLVAGYEATDTISAVDMVKEGGLSTDVGEKVYPELG